MSRTPRPSPRPTIHLELFITPRKRRAVVGRRLRAVYRRVRPLTSELGGQGPWAFRINSNYRSAAIPAEARLRRVFRVRASEDLWVEVAFYAGAREMASTLRQIWATPGVKRIVEKAESLNVRRLGAWTVDVGQALST